MTDLVLIVLIDGKQAAIPASEISSVIDLEVVTPVPLAPAYVAGLTTVRSQALTVIDCVKAMGLDGSERTGLIGARTAVVTIDGHDYALLVDEVADVCSVTSEPQAVRGKMGAGWQAVSKGLVETAMGPAVLLNVEALVSGQESKAA